VRQFLVGLASAAIFDIPQGLGEPAWAAKTLCKSPEHRAEEAILGSDLNVLFGGAFGHPMTIHIRFINGIARQFTIISLDACKFYGCVVDMPTFRRSIFIGRIISSAWDLRPTVSFNNETCQGYCLAYSIKVG